MAHLLVAVFDATALWQPPSVHRFWVLSICLEGKNDHTMSSELIGEVITFVDSCKASFSQFLTKLKLAHRYNNYTIRCHCNLFFFLKKRSDEKRDRSKSHTNLRYQLREGNLCSFSPLPSWRKCPMQEILTEYVLCALIKLRFAESELENRGGEQATIDRRWQTVCTYYVDIRCDLVA